MSGKLGNAVLYRIKDSNNKETQGARIYQPKVSNPQTNTQLDQRIKLAAANNQYRALRDIIDRGFEGVEYGNLSRRAFLKMALSGNFIGPYVPKGWTNPLPVTTPISKGSLAGLNVRRVIDSRVVLDILDATNSIGDTIGDLSKVLIKDFGWQTGDQFTVVYGYAINDNLGIAYNSESFYLDPDNTELIEDVLGAIEISRDGNYYALSVSNLSRDVLCAAVIQSREGSHLRSTSTFVRSAALSSFYSAAAATSARVSYKKTTNKTSDWPEDPQHAPAPEGGITYQGIAFTSAEVDPTTGAPYAIGRTSEGELYYAIKCVGERMRMYNKYLVGRTNVAASWSTERPDVADTELTYPAAGSDQPTDTDIKFFEWFCGLTGTSMATVLYGPQ